MRGALIGCGVGLFVVACSHGLYDGSYDGGPSTTGAITGTVTVGPDGASVSSADGAFSLLIPRGALTVPVNIGIGPAGTGGANTTGLYRVTMSPSVTLLHPASVTFDVTKATNGPTPIGDGSNLRLGSGADATSAPTTDALLVTGRLGPAGLVFTGITFELAHVFGLVGDVALGRAVTVPSCVTTCCADAGVTSAETKHGCGCAVLGSTELACIQDRCDAVSLKTGCATGSP